MLVIPIVRGAISSPYFRNDAVRNWVAVIYPYRHENNYRAFLYPPDNDATKFEVNEAVQVGEAIEFLAQVPGPRGGKNGPRIFHYGVVRTVSKDVLEVEEYDNETAAFMNTARVKTRAAGPREPRASLDRRRSTLQQKIDQLNRELRDLEMEVSIADLLDPPVFHPQQF